MKSNIDRRKEIFKGVIPSKGTEAYERLISYHKNHIQTPNEKKFYKGLFEKARNSLEAQHLSHSNFITEITLRHFLLEYNTRAWEHGLRSMSTLFNIMESFFVYRKLHIYFELIEEENYLISFFDFLDYITSRKFNDNKALIIDNLAENIIYNFNIGADLEKINFKTDENATFIISGLSIIRRINEVTVLLITGSDQKRTIKSSELEYDIDNPNKADLLKKCIEESEGKESKPLFIDQEEKYAKVLVVCRIDLESDTIDARYVAEEFDNFFSVLTDEADSFTDNNGDYISKEYEDIHKTGIKAVNSYSAIIEVAKAALYLPYYLNVFENDLIEESHDTEFKSINSNPLRKRKFKDTFGHKTSIKPLYVLNRNNKFSPDKIKLRDDLFRVETSGYWKKLNSDGVGQDKNGRAIHGKTWVNKKLSWFEAKQDKLIVSKDIKPYSGVNSGFIYVVRNPMMGKNIFKIGLTKNDVDERAKQLSKTSVPDKFYKAQEWNVRDCIKAEKRIHHELERYRIDPRREFFEIEYSEAVAVISRICEEINKTDV